MTGQADSSDGDLDSIFAKMDGSQQQVRHKLAIPTVIWSSALS